MKNRNATLLTFFRLLESVNQKRVNEVVVFQSGAVLLPSQSSASAGFDSCWFLFGKVFKVNEWRARWHLFVHRFTVSEF